MGRLLKMAVSAELMLMLTLAGCGGSSSTSHSSSTAASASQTTSSAATQTSAGAPSSAPNNEQASQPGEPKHFPKITLPVSSPVFSAGSKIPVRYTCDGAGTSPPLQWKAIPRGTTELALFVFNPNSASAEKPLIYWAVTGLHPALEGISAGKLPPGAIVGRNSLGQSSYTICPPKSDGLQHYAVALLAMPHSVSATPGFNANALYKTVLHTAEYAGLAGFTYQRH
jgi:phosphatidylethanolamine-binding protein (PEBP) family uncharacterized protein